MNQYREATEDEKRRRAKAIRDLFFKSGKRGALSSPYTELCDEINAFHEFNPESGRRLRRHTHGKLAVAASAAGAVAGAVAPALLPKAAKRIPVKKIMKRVPPKRRRKIRKGLRKLGFRG